jgi:hypothetical protein
MTATYAVEWECRLVRTDLAPGHMILGENLPRGTGATPEEARAQLANRLSERFADTTVQYDALAKDASS